jgi:hypothetical protein
MSRRHVPHLSLAIVGILTLGAIAISVNTDKAANITAPGTPNPNKGNPYGAPGYAFGGYSIYRPTTEIGAEWRVPAINAQSSDGDASTWIAAEDEDRQFIQLGTTEDKRNGVSVYAIFWSDVTVNFQPQQLLNVAPGDLITFSMRQVSSGWRLRFDDLTDATPETVTIPYARGTHFNLGQWLQEDPTIGGLTQHLPYPSMQVPSFTHLTLNNSAPSIHEDDGQVLSTVSGVQLEPTKAVHDQFSFRNATGPARQYLQDVFAFNVALYPFQVDLFYNESPDSFTMEDLVTTLTSLRKELATQTWPKVATSAIKDDVQELTRYLKLYRNYPRLPTPPNARILAQLTALNAQNVPIAKEVRHLLGLPPPN